MKASELSQKKTKRSLAVDLSSGIFEIVLMESLAGQHRLLAYDVRKISSDAKENQKAAVDFIQDFLKKNFVTGKDVVLNISDMDSVIIKNLTLPVLPEEEIRGVAKWQLTEDVPFDLDTASLDWQVIREFTDDEGVKKNDLIFVIAKKETIDDYLSVIYQCQLNPVGITISSFSYSHLLKHLPQNPKVLAVLDIDYDDSTLGIYTDNKLNFVRRLPMSWEKIVRSLTDILASEKGKIELSHEEAEELKNTFGIPLDETQFAKDNVRATHILSLIRPLLEALVREIRFSFDYFTANFIDVCTTNVKHFERTNVEILTTSINVGSEKVSNGERPGLLYITGGGANLKNLDRYLNNELNMKVAFLSLPSCVEHQRPGQQNLNQEEQNKIINTVGAALRDASAVNLLPREIKTRQSEFRQKISLRLVATTAAAVLLFILFIAEFQIYDYSNRLKNAQIHLATIRPVQLLMEKIQAKERLIEKIQRGRVPGSGLLKVISRAIPGEVILEELNFDGAKNSLTLQGGIEAAEEDAEALLSDFMEHLTASAYFTQAGLVSSQRIDEAEKFEIKCSLPGQ